MKPPRTIDWSAVHEKLEHGSHLLESAFAPEPAQVERVLAERAEALLHRDDKPSAATARRSVLLLEIGSHVAGIEVHWVREVLNLPQGHVPVPDAHELLVGVVNVHSQIVNLVNPWPLLNEAAPAAPHFPHAVLLRHGHLAVAIGCTQVLDLAHLPEDAWRDERLFVFGAAERTAVLLDIRALLSPWEKEAQAQKAL